ncbi:MAG: 1-aminocyclopropane-1-carboxylate deaminase/D-cysteine desulfhydrase [Chitinophagales bacterium]
MLQKINISNTTVSILRTDMMHPEIQGNKYYKLKYNLEAAKLQEKDTLLTFGGAFSNHIYATAASGKKYGFKTIGIIRGEQPDSYLYTLQSAKEMGMQLHFIARDVFRYLRNENFDNSSDFLSTLNINWDKTYIIPEGGTNPLAVKGSAEILSELNADFDIVCVPVGTGGTIAGIINSLEGKKKVMGFSSLKGGFLSKDVVRLLDKDYQNWSINTDYHFGGYGKWNNQLIDFINDFQQSKNIPLCPIYTGKMMYGIADLLKKEYFPNETKILAIHTGGLQGIKGFNQLNTGKAEII